ncbi:MAG: ferrous iron transport protein A [Propionibacteriaceae bacterium]|nr:ferrous iron transport protein A [Propionibacteriaceae bacterium]
MKPTPGPVWSLDRAPVDEPLVIAATAADPRLAHRLMTLGWRAGSPVRVLKTAAGGAKVLDLGGSRIAVGRGLARTLTVVVPR